MKLWEKNYILTMALILLVLYGSMFFVAQYSFKTNLKKVCEQGVRTGNSILYSVQSLFNEETQHIKLKLYCNALQEQGAHIAVYQENIVIADHLPFALSQSSKEKVQIMTTETGKYLCVFRCASPSGSGKITVCYVDELNGFYKSHQKQVYLLLFMSGAIAAFIGAILYFAMKKLYYPINNIAHELRTPLTSIQGYAQYMLLGKISDEDRQHACTRINEETGYINRMIERLLVMENMKNGKIEFKKIRLTDLLAEIKKQDPSIITHSEMEYVIGDRTLLLCLLLNLLSNLRRAGGPVSITAQSQEICLHSQKDFLEEDMLRILNSNRAVPKDKIKGKGLGVPLCHEIIKLHHGKLHYACGKYTGVTVTVRFSDQGQGLVKRL